MKIMKTLRKRQETPKNSGRKIRETTKKYKGN